VAEFAREELAKYALPDSFSPPYTPRWGAGYCWLICFDIKGNRVSVRCSLAPFPGHSPNLILKQTYIFFNCIAAFKTISLNFRYGWDYTWSVIASISVGTHHVWAHPQKLKHIMLLI
jgi:hypothetical protein